MCHKSDLWIWNDQITECRPRRLYMRLAIIYDVRIVCLFFKSGISECILYRIKLIKKNSILYNCTKTNINNNNNKFQQEKLI